MEVTSGPAPLAPGRPTTTATADGKELVIRKLTPLDHMRVFEMLGGELSDNGSYMNLALTAASVVSIDGTAEAMPTSKVQIEAMVSRLDFNGLNAVSKAYKAAFGAAESGNPDDIKK